MKVFELLIDWDGTTRSRLETFGLYTTRAKAAKAYHDLVDHFRERGGFGVLGGHTINERIVE